MRRFSSWSGYVEGAARRNRQTNAISEAKMTRACYHAGPGVHGLSYARHVPGRSHLGRRAGKAPRRRRQPPSSWACRVISCHGSEGLASDAASAAAAAAGAGLIRGSDRDGCCRDAWAGNIRIQRRCRMSTASGLALRSSHCQRHLSCRVARVRQDAADCFMSPSSHRCTQPVMICGGLVTRCRRAQAPNTSSQRRCGEWRWGILHICRGSIFSR
jgi:hypothetical protein